MDENINARVLELQLCGRKVLTPCKTVEKTIPNGDFFDFTVQFNAEYLDQILVGNFGKDAKGEPKKTNSLNETHKKRSRDLINVMLPTYNDKSISDKQLSKMESIHYVNSDVLVLPNWEGAWKSTDSVVEVKRLNGRYIKEIRTLNNKLIMGYLPLSQPPDVLSELVDDFRNQDVVSFVVDYRTCASSTKSDLIRDIQKKIINDGYYDESFLYSVNTRRTTLVNKELYPADDFLLYGHGIDIIGNLHMGGGSPDSTPSPAKRFDKTQYTYFIDSTSARQDSSMIKAHNYVDQNSETRSLIDTISEEGSTLELLKTKNGAKHSLRDMLRNRDARSLDDLF